MRASLAYGDFVGPEISLQAVVKFAERLRAEPYQLKVREKWVLVNGRWMCCGKEHYSKMSFLY